MEQKPFREQIFIYVFLLFAFGVVAMMGFHAVALSLSLVDIKDCMEQLQWMMTIVAGWVGTAVGYYFGAHTPEESGSPGALANPG